MKLFIPLLVTTAIAWLISPQVGLAQDRIELTGLVVSTNGTPITNATVTIWAAKPREGGRSVCASCYPDCGKHALSGPRGTFTVEGLDPELLFRLLVRAPGYRPQFSDRADPFGSAPRVSLKPLQFDQVPPAQTVLGKIIGPDGKAVAGAVIDVQGSRFGTYSYYGGTSGKMDSMAATDENGNFRIGATNNLQSITINLEAPKLAKRRLWLEVGKAHLIRMTDGVTVTGRILHDGKPLAGIPVSMGTQERESSVYMDGFDSSTDAEGTFTLVNVPPNNRFSLYSKMKSTRTLGVIVPVRSVTTAADGSTVPLGDILAQPALIIRGRVTLSDGKPIPARSRLYMGLENASDSQDVRLPEDGTFEIAGIPPTQVSFSIRIPGYRVSAKNPGKDWLNEGRLVGTLTQNLDNFVIHLEPGGRFPDSDQSGPDRQPSSKPLRGADL